MIETLGRHLACQLDGVHDLALGLGGVKLSVIDVLHRLAGKPGKQSPLPRREKHQGPSAKTPPWWLDDPFKGQAAKLC